MTPAIWIDVQDDLDAALQAAGLAVAKNATLHALPPDLRTDREIAIGKHMHDAYSAAEKALQRVIMAVDADLPTSRAFHRDLLDRAARHVPGGRPPILTPETVDGLVFLMRFRHAFRHAYGGYDFPRARENLAVVGSAIPRLRTELLAFAATLGLAPRA